MVGGFETHRLHQGFTLPFYVYILRSQTTQRYYVEQTIDLEKPLAYHCTNYLRSLRLSQATA